VIARWYCLLGLFSLVCVMPIADAASSQFICDGQ
jgi:hypothetical protein